MPNAATSSEESAARNKTVRIRRALILKALADPRRFRLLELVAAADSPLSCAVAREALTISPATLSHHIKELEAAGLVRAERQGKFVFLSLRPEVWSAFQDSLAALGKSRAPRS